jgi:peptidoglycan hydrolase-like protein with peptidoglycan-binding domain
MNKKLIIPSLLAMAGIGFIGINLLKRYKQKKATAPGSVDKSSGSNPQVVPSNPAPFTPTGGTTAAGFPLKRGSKGTKVVELQQAIGKDLLPKFGFDGDYGSETEAAVLKLLNKATVDSQADIDKIKALRSQSALENKKYEAGKKMIEAFKSNPSLMLTATVDTTGTAVTVNYQNHWIFGTKKLKVYKGNKLSRVDYIPRQVSGIGNLLIEVTRGEFAGYWVFNPLDLTLINNSTLSFTGTEDGFRLPEIWPY